jgi:hypothetical protein
LIQEEIYASQLGGYPLSHSPDRESAVFHHTDMTGHIEQSCFWEIVQLAEKLPFFPKMRQKWFQII